MKKLVLALVLLLLASFITNNYSVYGATTTTITQTMTVTNTLSSVTPVITQTMTVTNTLSSVTPVITQTMTVRGGVGLGNITRALNNTITNYITTVLITNITNTYTVSNTLSVPQVTTTTTRVFERSINCPVKEDYINLTTMLLYNVSGKLVIESDNITNKTFNLIVYPYNYGQYQVVCSSLYYCGFRSSLQIVYYGDRKELEIYVQTINYPDIIKRTGSSVYFYVEIVDEVKDFNIGSLIVWSARILSRDDKGVVTIDTTIPLWSAFYQRENNMYPYPYEIYVSPSDNTLVKVYDCGSLHFLVLCPSDNPIVCALWSFMKLFYDLISSILPEPVRNFINLFSPLGTIVNSIMKVLTNPLLIQVVTLFIPLLLFVALYVTIEKEGVGGIVFLFYELFEKVKSIIMSIVQFLRSLLP